MTLTAGAISLQSKTATTANLIATAATGGSGPYTYQWYRSTTSGFTPGGGNILSGKTALSLADTGLIPGTLYYYKVVATDTGNSNVTIEYTQLGVTTSVQNQGQNQFAQSVITGMLDLRLNFNTVAVQVAAAETGTVYPGAALKFSDVAISGGNTVPEVLLATAITDEVCGFANYNIKQASFVAGQVLEMSMAGNVIYLMSTGAISRGAQLSIDPTTIGGVQAFLATGNYIGFALDKASAGGQNIRVMLACPSYVFHS